MSDLKQKYVFKIQLQKHFLIKINIFRTKFYYFILVLKNFVKKKKLFKLFLFRSYSIEGYRYLFYFIQLEISLHRLACWKWVKTKFSMF